MINDSVVKELSESRQGIERRKRIFRSFIYSFFRRRRQHVRRDEESFHNTYVDIHEPRIFIIFSLTVLLSAIDAMLTLFIISNGGEEINPVMQYLLEIDITTFFWAKFFMTSFGMLFLVSHKHFLIYQTLRGYHLLYAIFGTYFVLINYELYLISQILTS